MAFKDLSPTVYTHLVGHGLIHGLSVSKMNHVKIPNSSRDIINETYEHDTPKMDNSKWQLIQYEMSINHPQM